KYVDSDPVGACERIGTDIERVAAALEGVESGHDVVGVPDLEGGDFDPELARCRLRLFDLQHAERIPDIAHDRQTAETGNNLAQEFKPLAGEICAQGRQARDVATRSRQTGDEIIPDGVASGREYDRDC